MNGEPRLGVARRVAFLPGKHAGGLAPQPFKEGKRIERGGAVRTGRDSRRVTREQRPKPRSENLPQERHGTEGFPRPFPEKGGREIVDPGQERERLDFLDGKPMAQGECRRIRPQLIARPGIGIKPRERLLQPG